VAYSLLLLNTDLHVAELTTRMSRAQFVRNTLFTIQMQLQPNRSVQGSSSDLVHGERDAVDVDSLRGPGSEGSDIGASMVRSQAKRSDSITSWNSISRDAALANLFVASPSVMNAASLPNDSTASVPASTTSVAEAKTPSTLVSSVVYDRNWESDMESLLKVRSILIRNRPSSKYVQDMYNAIKSQQVLQPLSSRTSTSSAGLIRNRSLRAPQDRLTTFKRGSIRGIQSILGAPNGISPYSSNSSIDGRTSPAPSFATSAHEVRLYRIYRP
jgi:PH and SEC7 domain-containing protein